LNRFALLAILPRDNVRAVASKKRYGTPDQIAMQSLEGFILAGGASSRMGADKSKLVLDGQTFVERVATALSSVANTITVVGKRHANVQSKLPTVFDIYEKWGALGGLHAALSACQADWAVVVACDLPFVTGALLARLVSLRADIDAVVPVQRDGRPQPLCAIYRVGPCLKIAEELIESGEHRPIALVQSARTRLVAFEDLADLDGANRFFDNMNTPDDYARAQKGDGYHAEVMN
jgi:molybdopterin-guanine dinucleotide biosynthesis protein A